MLMVIHLSFVEKRHRARIYLWCFLDGVDWIGTFRWRLDHVQRPITLRHDQTISSVPRVYGEETKDTVSGGGAVTVEYLHSDLNGI
jgi:hypothetical protein